MNINFIFLILALLAEIIGTIGGFGSSVFFVPIGNFYFDFHSVLGLTAIFHLSSNLSKIAQFRKGIDKNLILFIGIPSVVFVMLGSFFSKYISSNYLEITLGLFLILLSALFLLKRKLIVKPNRKNSVIGGALSGFSAGILGTGGAIRGLTMAAYNLEKSVFIATSAIIDLMIDLTRSVTYYHNGYIHMHDMIYIPFLFLIGWIGTYIGKKIVTTIPQDKFRFFSLVLILAIGLVTVGKLIWF